MSEARTAGLIFLLVIPQEALPHEEGPLDVSLDRIAELIPEAADELLGLREGDWEFIDAFAQDGGLLDEEGNGVLETVVSFSKTFEPGTTEVDVIADARRCGVTEDYAPQFNWEGDEGLADDEGSVDVGYWYMSSFV